MRILVTGASGFIGWPVIKRLLSENHKVLAFSRTMPDEAKFLHIKWLKAKAIGNTRERVRLCTHQSVEDAVHEMLIVHIKGTYIRPHKHPNKSESFHIIEGTLDIVIFDDAGNIFEVVNMGEYSSGDQFFWRLSQSYFHTVIPRSDVVVFHETTGGPFVKETSNVPAPWSPTEDDIESIDLYTKRLNTSVRLRKDTPPVEKAQ